MKAQFGTEKVDAELVPGSNGVFDVVVEGKRLFSKDDVDRFPEYQELPNMIIMEGLDE